MRARRWSRCLWVLTGALALLLVLKTFVADVYRVDSGSMRPTLFGGRERPDAEEDAEHVLVLYDRGFAPRRFDLVVIRSPDGTKPLVKRVCGLPGDQDLVIRDGDLFIDRRRLGPDVPRPAPIPVFDDRYQDPEQFFIHLEDGSVRRAGDEWLVDGPARSPGSVLYYKPPLRDDYLDRHHRRVPGVIEVNDAVLELEFALEGPLAEQKLHFDLVEEGDTFETTLALEGGRAVVTLARRNRDKPVELTRASVAPQAGRFYRLSFSNVDNCLRVRAPELSLDLRASYDENEPWPAPLPPGHRTRANRVDFGAESGRARFRRVRVLRDLYYTDPDSGRYGLPAEAGRPGDGPPRGPISLGPDDYFLLGDNSAASTDSRQLGAMKAADLIGRPLAVVWPEPRWLHPVADP